ncbi:phosphatase PAP2 family protein [Devosia sp.]|uniref:phosphatase PAP2 family protein n=1 Tax=Devosia sp. TaxID=1871048 RepID=UPI00260E8FF5|nr:phosphatase PAP2 family protein [Devosia sp.]
MKLPVIPASRRPILFAALALAVLLGAFGFVADEVIEGDTVVFDTAVTMVLRDNGDIMNPIGPAWLEEAGRDVTSLGSFSILGLIVILVLISLVLIKRPLTATYVTFAVLSGTVLSSVFKQIYDRPRPPMLEAMRVFTSSFPSGHATVSAVVYLTLAALLAPLCADRRLATLCIVAGIFLTLLVGVSRVYLGVHYPTDVIAGWSLGAAWALLCWVGANLLGLNRR